MKYVLLLLPIFPLLGAVAVLALRQRPQVAGQVARTFVAAAAVAATAVVIGTGLDGTLALVHEGDDGRAVIGLVADRGEAILALLTVLVGTVVISFALRALDGDPRQNRFLVLASLLTASTATVAVSATGSGLAIAWIVTGAALAALIGHRHEWTPAREAAQRTRRSFAIGDIALGAAVVISIVAIGDLDLRSVGADAEALEADELAAGVSMLDLVAVLVVVAGIARSALIPLHRWLPSTIAAPTPASALLHAGVVNGIGVLMIRLAPAVGISAPAMWLAFVAGALTALVATAVMLVRADAKGALAWSTAGQMGFMTVQLAVGAFAAALFHLVGHAMYKASLFLGAGDTVSARNRHRHLPHPTSSLPRAGRVPLATVVAAAAMVLAFVAFDPHVTTAAAVLVIGFGTLTTARAVNGWLRSAPATASAIGLGLIGGVGAAFAYVGGITVFETHVADTVPFEVSGAVPVGALIAALVLVGLATATIAWLPGQTGSQLRRRAYGVLHAISAPPLRARETRNAMSRSTTRAEPASNHRMQPAGRVLAR